MKRLLLTLLGVALANAAWAQTPQYAQPTGMPVVLPTYKVVPATIVTPASVNTGIQPVSGGRVLNGCAYGGVCCNTCCTPTKTICVPEPAVKVTKKNLYSSACENVCYPKCSLLPFFGSCSSCEQGNCDSHIYTKRILVKKVCVTECPTTKCVAVTVPACASGTIIRRDSGPSGTPIETIPAQPMPALKK